jgi:hypothetical protein
VSVSPADLPTLLAALRPRGRPRLVVHWASWDELSTAGLPAVRALVAGVREVDAVGVVWDEALDAPTGRIPGMAQRPARWSGGDQAEAWLRQVGITWPNLVYAGDFEALFAALGLADRVVPQVVLVGADGAVIARHVGALAGEGWEGFVRRVKGSSGEIG